MKSTGNFLVGKYAILGRRENGDFGSFFPILSHSFSMDVRPRVCGRTFKGCMDVRPKGVWTYVQRRLDVRP